MSHSSSIVIRKVKSEEAISLQTISKNTFFSTYASENTKEDMDAYLTENFNIDRLQNSLLNPDSFYYFAIHEEAIIGYLKVNRGAAQTDNLLPKALEIERIYVITEFQGKGIGMLLLEKAIEKAHSLSIKILWLGVWEKNTKAIAFYKKHMFVPFANHHFMVGTDEQYDVLMKLELSF